MAATVMVAGTNKFCTTRRAPRNCEYFGGEEHPKRKLAAPLERRLFGGA
ncbi:hypothetical protein [Arthrobacter polaris]